MNEAETFGVRATVIVVVPEFHQAILRTSNDERQLAITRHTAGVSLSDVREGQVYLLTVTRRFARVLHAKLVDPENTATGRPQI